MTLSAVDSIHRGLVNLRANWELVPVQFLQIFIVAVLTVVGFIPPLAVLGFGDLGVLDSTTQDWSTMMDSAAGLLSRGREAWILLLASGVLSLAIWTMAGMVYCFFQAGVYGILMAGDRQAPGGKPQRWQWFRTFSVRDLRGWGARYLWRYFWLLNLFLLIMTVSLVIPVVFVLLAMWGEARWGTGASMGIGCGGMLLFGFSLFVVAFWASLAQADLARSESSVLLAARNGLLVLSRRLGAVILVAIAGAVVSIALALATFGITLVGQLGIGPSFALQLGWQLAINLVEWIVSCVVGVAFIAVMIALVSSEASVGVAT